MKLSRTIGLCFAAVLTLGAFAAASASAEEFAGELARYMNCEKATKFNRHETGRYTEKGCVTLSGTHEGEYELSGWGAGETSTFKSTGGKSIFYFYANGGGDELTPGGSGGAAWTVTCAKSKGAGEITAPRGGWITLTYEKCTGKQEPGGAVAACTSAAGKGKIETEKLATEVGSFFYHHGEAAELTINEASSTVAQFECGGATFELKDDVGRPEVVGLINACSKTMTLSFTVGEGGEPEPWAHDGSAADWPRAEINDAFFALGLESSETLKAKQSFCVFNQFPKE